MTLDTAFFKAGDTSFGIFYPKGYVLSVFPNVDDAGRAVDALRRGGFGDDHVLLASGAEVVEYARAMRADPALLHRFERFVSGLYGDEATMAEELVGLAEREHAFVAVYAPDGAATDRVAALVRTFAPVVVRKYDALTSADLR